MAASSGILWVDTLFDSAVSALYWTADLLGVTYEEINVYIFCILWPVQTIAQIIWWIRRRRA